MGLIALATLRLAATLSAMAVIHWTTKRQEARSALERPRLGIPCFALLSAVLMLLPVFGSPTLVPFPSASALGAWTLLCLGVALGSSPDQDEAWLLPFGLGLGSAVTVFSSVDLGTIANIQTQSLSGPLPKWGLFVHPFGFAISLVAVAGWARPALSMAPHRPSGFGNACLLGLLVCIFLGAGSPPWVSDSLEWMPGLSGMLVGFTWWLLWGAKLWLLWFLIGFLTSSPNLDTVWARPLVWTALAAANLVLTWGFFAWRQGG